MNTIIKFSIENKLVIGMATLLLIIWGIWSFNKLPIDAVPDITNNQVQVITTTNSYAAEEVEKYITFPVEQGLVSIPHITEMRSISRSGLSVITIVFDESIDIYWARQQVSERLVNISKSLSDKIGIPELMPVTTGLGEIYQYILKPQKGYEEKYSLEELRSIQDWVIRKQLLGTPGVADVSSFGGYVKQFQIEVDPHVLYQHQLAIQEIYESLVNNNINIGGAYIEKNPQVYFIRGEGAMKNFSDIENTLIKKTKSGHPIFVKDIAKVNIGHALRYGAMTYNTTGEVTGAIVMMLKDENSSKVIELVKTKINSIQKTLPEGLVIEAFLDRTKLVDNAIFTVSKNLLEGALIVIFVLVMFLGNLRAGFIVASVIPLAMLFAIGLMNVFGVSGNLMSLGALDFGLIVDGAVIIVEATIHHFYIKYRTNTNVQLTPKEINQETYFSAVAIRKAAAFGEIIILIVYIPILTLTGVEGKMFIPMAQTVSFAILGAFILSLTYVPMMSSWLLVTDKIFKKNFADHWIEKVQEKYLLSLKWVLRNSKLVLFFAIGTFFISLYQYTRLGGEFLPSLDEGDFAVETRLLPGSSLQKTVDATIQASDTLLKNFTEIEKIVGKIGSSEIPTDPMPLEACDLMIILKDKSEWKLTDDKDELADLMQAKLSAIPGVNFSFQQPIQMRFNELMTGSKQDVVIKLFGDDLDKLNNWASEIEAIVSKVKGAEDIYKEEITGMPQLNIKFDRKKMALYQIDVATAEIVINSCYAGVKTGSIYEGYQQYDVVIRLDEAYKSIDNIASLPVQNIHGEKIPLAQFADISFIEGPAQVQRENAQRRVTVAFNVRNRDVKSIVEEIKVLLDGQLILEPGYFLVYGGTFENLENAMATLMIVVPIALIMILFLLYITFNSVQASLLIFTAIPFAATGGVWALTIRDMPFSISAGVGFIALFGVAVLNGIVLIAELLKKQNHISMVRNILYSTHIRLRPVLLTATVASLGFLPMAIAQSAGAEVQKPLATVVIGGLITSTVLTLYILPVLYLALNKKK